MSATAIDKRTKRRSPGKIDTGKAIELLAKGVKQTDIAKMMNVSDQAISERLSRFKSFLDNPKQIRVFESNEDKILTGAKMEFLAQALDPSALKKASTLQAATAYCQVFDKQRLMRNQSTENISVKSVVSRIADELKRLEDDDDTQDVVLEARSGDDPDSSKS